MRTFPIKTMRAAVAALRPRDGLFAVDVDDAVLKAAMSFIPYMPLILRLGFPLGLLALEFAAPLLGGGPRRFTSMDGERAEAYLRRWERAGGLRGTMLNGMRSLVLICFYQQPRVLAAMEVDWQGRADRLTAARARLAASGAGTEA